MLFLDEPPMQTRTPGCEVDWAGMRREQSGRTLWKSFEWDVHVAFSGLIFWSRYPSYHLCVLTVPLALQGI